MVGTTYRFVAGDTVTATLYHTDQAFYRFRQSVRDARNANGNPFAQPSGIYSNVQGGVGIFAVLSAATATKNSTLISLSWVMLTSLRGIFANGAVHLTEPAPATLGPIEVVVVFLEPNGPLSSPKADREAPITDLAQASSRNEHMTRLRASWQQARELATGMKGPTLSEEVLSERQEGN